MVFATLEDETGLINLVFTPQVYKRFRRLFDRQAFLCVQGQLQRQGDAHAVKVTVVFAPQVKEAEIIHLDDQAATLAKALIQSRHSC